MTDTADKRNELESYIYAMRTKLEGTLKKYSTSNENQQLNSLMTEAEDWLYGDGFDSTIQEYSTKLDGQYGDIDGWMDGWIRTVLSYHYVCFNLFECVDALCAGLRAVGNPIESRLWEENNRPAAIDSLKRQTGMCKVRSVSVSVLDD